MSTHHDTRQDQAPQAAPRVTEAEGSPGRPDTKATGELLQDLTHQLTTLIHEEVELAKAEMGRKANQAAKGAGALSGAAVLAVLGLAALVAAGIAGLHQVLSVWLSALIVGGALLVVGGLAALVGRSKVSASTPPVPAEAVESTKEDVAWLKTHAQSAKR